MNASNPELVVGGEERVDRGDPGVRGVRLPAHRQQVGVRVTDPGHLNMSSYVAAKDNIYR